MKLFGSARAVAATARDVAAEYDAHGPHVVGQAHQAIGEQLVAGLFSIHNPYGGRSGPGFYSQIAGLLLGLAFVAMGVQLYSLSTPDGDATVTGSVTQVIAHSGSSTCSLRAEFWVDGVPYETRANHSSSTFCPLETGDAVEIRYHSDNPADADIDEGSIVWFVMIFPAAGLIVMIPALVGLVFSAAAIFFGWRLMRSGRAMAAANPATSTDQGIVAEAKEKFTSVVTTLRGGASTTVAAAPGTKFAQSLGLIPSTATAPPVPVNQVDQAGAPVAPAAIAAGWYRTADGASERWHDGVHWTAHVRPYAPPPHH